ncbi:MAG: hypothetical protein ABI082_02300 [Dokdonella sp.]
MERIRISYFDQNANIEAQMPMNADVIQKTRLEGSSHEWWSVALERPLEHQGASYPLALVASRWPKHPLGGPKPSSAFLLLAPSRTLQRGAKLSDFPFVAWCMIECGGP